VHQINIIHHLDSNIFDVMELIFLMQWSIETRLEIKMPAKER